MLVTAKFAEMHLQQMNGAKRDCRQIMNLTWKVFHV